MTAPIAPDVLAVVTLLLYCLALARAARLLTLDVITEPLRIAIERRWPDTLRAYLASCPWCVSLWLAAVTAWAPLYALDLPLWLWPLLALAASHVAGLLNPPVDDVTIIEER